MGTSSTPVSNALLGTVGDLVLEKAYPSLKMESPL